MRVIARKTLIEFWHKVPDSQNELEVWFDKAKSAMWKTPADIKIIYIRFIGTHKQYDAIDAGAV